MALDVISIVIGWLAFGDIRNRSIGKLFAWRNGRERRITTKEANSKKAPEIAEEFESAVKDRGYLFKAKKACAQAGGPLSPPHRGRAYRRPDT
jgi:hypothetical protein